MALIISSLGLLSIWSVSTVQASISQDLVVETGKGKIQGFESTTAHGRSVSAWYGIPFAKPPLGDLRFKHPQPMENWDGIKEAKELPKSCVQIRDIMWPGFSGSEALNPNTKLSEDCLYLNVVVPKPHPENAAVLLWIYGFGFWGGTTTLDLYDLRTIASEENIIAVGIQYRVGSLGFLYLDDEEVPGNAGVLDQVMAMQWVKDNIWQFGGNPDNITIMGQSAGAFSVGLHLLSPLSRDLFSQAIMQSASALAPWGVGSQKESLQLGLRFAEVMKCKAPKNRTATIDCLRKADPLKMVDYEWNGIRTGFAIGIFTPIVDGRFLEDMPALQMKQKNFKNANILLGSNKDEGNYNLFYYMAHLFPKQEDDVFLDKSDFKHSVNEINYNANVLQRKAIEHEYTNWMNPDDTVKNRELVDKMVGDPHFTCPVMDFAHRYAETGNNVYVYHFSHRSSVSPWPKWSGAIHGDEIPFVFGRPLEKSSEKLEYSRKEVKLSKEMMNFWANFAKTGNPSLSANLTWTDSYWPLHTPLKREILHLEAKRSGYLQVIEGNRVRQCAFWREFFPLLSSKDYCQQSFPFLERN